MSENVKKIRELNDFDVNTPISKDDFLIVATKDGAVPATNKATIEAIMSAYSAGATDGSDTTTDPDGNTIIDPSKKPGVDIDNGNGGTLRQDTTPATAQNIDQFVQGGDGGAGGTSGLITIEECRDINLSVVDCTDASVAYKTKKLSIDPEGMIDGGANNDSGLTTVEECRNANDVVVDCSDPSVVYRTKKLSLDLGGHDKETTVLTFHEKNIPLFELTPISTDKTTAHNYNGGNANSVPHSSFSPAFYRRFLRKKITYNNKGVRSGYSAGPGDLMSFAVYHTPMNDWWINSATVTDINLYRPSHPNRMGQFPNINAAEFYSIYKKFGAPLDYGTIWCNIEAGMPGGGENIHSMWIRPYPYLDSNEADPTIKANAWTGIENLVKTTLRDDGNLTIWSFLPAQADVGLLSNLEWVYTTSENYPWYYSQKLKDAGHDPWFYWEVYVDPAGNDIGYRKNAVFLTEWGGWTTIQALSQYVLDGTVPTFSGGAAPPANSDTSDPDF